MRSAAFWDEGGKDRRQQEGRQPRKQVGRGHQEAFGPGENQEPAGGRAQWFQHDQRADSYGGDRRGYRGERGGEFRGPDAGSGPDRGQGQKAPRSRREEEPRKVDILSPEVAKWEYQDPKGNVQGLFTSKLMLTWADKGQLPTDLQVRQKGYTSFTPLGKVLPVIRREVEGGKGDQIAPVLRKLGEASRVLEVPVERTDGGSRQDGRGRDKARPRTIRPEGADSVVARPVSAAARPGEPGKGPERRKRGPDTRNKGPGKAAPVQEQPPVSARVPYNTVKELFTASATKGSDQPVWRYIDPTGTVQGPFPANHMLSWYDDGHLMPTLPICGTERKVAPPDLPSKELYIPLGQLLQDVQSGSKFKPVTLDFIRRESQPATSPAPASKASAGPRSGVLLPGQDHSSGTKAADLQQDKASAPESAKPATPTPPVATKSIADALPDSRTEPPTSGAAEASASEVPDLSAHSEPSAEKADSVSASQPAEHAATEALPEAGATAELPEAPATAEPEDSQAVDDVVPDVKEKLQAAHEGETVPPATEEATTLPLTTENLQPQAGSPPKLSSPGFPKSIKPSPGHAAKPSLDQQEPGTPHSIGEASMVVQPGSPASIETVEPGLLSASSKAASKPTAAVEDDALYAGASATDLSNALNGALDITPSGDSEIAKPIEASALPPVVLPGGADVSTSPVESPPQTTGSADASEQADSSDRLAANQGTGEALQPEEQPEEQLNEEALITRADADALEPASNKSTNDQSLAGGTTLAAAAAVEADDDDAALSEPSDGVSQTETAGEADASAGSLVRTKQQQPLSGTLTASTGLADADLSDANKPAAEKSSNLQDSLSAPSAEEHAPAAPLSTALPSADTSDADKPALQTVPQLLGLAADSQQPAETNHLLPASASQPTAPAADPQAGLSHFAQEESGKPAVEKVDNLQSLSAASALEPEAASIGAFTPAPEHIIDQAAAEEEDASKPAQDKLSNRQATSAQGALPSGNEAVQQKAQPPLLGHALSGTSHIDDSPAPSPIASPFPAAAAAEEPGPTAEPTHAEGYAGGLGPPPNGRSHEVQEDSEAGGQPEDEKSHQRPGFFGKLVSGFKKDSS